MPTNSFGNYYNLVTTPVTHEATLNDVPTVNLTTAKYTYVGQDLAATLDEQLFKINNIAFQVESVSDPVYEKVSDKFGVLRHIDVVSNLFISAKSGIDDLRGELQSGGGDSLFDKLNEYFSTLSEDESNEVLDKYFNDFRDDGQFSLGEIEEYTDDIDTSEPNADYRRLFNTGKVMRKDILLMQSLRSSLSVFRKYQQRKLKVLRSELAEVEDTLPLAHKELANLNRERIAELSDYQVVRQLVREDWQAVEHQYAERERILNNHQGLYFVRVRETPVSKLPVSPLPLRYSHPDDLVPGCALEDKDLPEELEVFMESVLDIRMSDWISLRSEISRLPSRSRLHKWLEQRQRRVDYQQLNSQVSPTFSGLRLGRLYSQNLVVARDMVRRQVVSAQSLVDFQRAASNVLSLDDLLSGPPHRLRGPAETLRNKLDQAGHCLLSQLRRVAPSIRLDWAEAAEQDTLEVENPVRWPGLEKAQARDFNQVRTLIDLVNWWFRQLADDADSSSYTAIRNLVRASLLVAAADDPEAILHGQLKTLPPRFNLGASLRVQLNREAVPGTLLQMVDSANELVGTLRVDDFDAQGAVTTITQLHKASAMPSTQFTVTGLAVPGQVRL